MGIVFAVLAILALSIKGISLLDRKPLSSPASEPVVSAPVVQVTSDGITGEQVAAIAVALALSEPKSSSIGATISPVGSTADSWLQSGRIRALGSNSTGARERRN